MTDTTTCPLCENACTLSKSGLLIVVKCPVCGTYRVTEHAFKMSIPDCKDRYIISGVVRNDFEQNDRKKVSFTITENMIEDDAKFQAEFLSKAPKTINSKAFLLLQYIAHKSRHPGDKVEISLPKDYPICFCKNADELRFYIGYLEDINAMSANVTLDGTGILSLTADGWVEFEKLQKPNAESKQAFVAMWFDSQMDEPFLKGILPLEDQNETGFKMMRIDQKHFNDKICDHIIAEIKQSRFMIADCTESRPAVFFEAGYAMGMGLPVIFTCREGTDIKKCFDTDHYNHIVWKDAEDLKTKLKDRILATIGKVQ